MSNRYKVLADGWINGKYKTKDSLVLLSDREAKYYGHALTPLSTDLEVGTGPTAPVAAEPADEKPHRSKSRGH